MQATAHRTGTGCVLLAILASVAGPLGGQDSPSVGALWVPVIAKLASALSQSDAAGALEVFDSGTKTYGAIESRIGALTSQANIACALDVIENKENDGVALLDVDWYMQLKSRADGGPTERRRQRVQLQMKQIRGKWKIFFIDPIGILDPILIK